MGIDGREAASAEGANETAASSSTLEAVRADHSDLARAVGALPDRGRVSRLAHAPEHARAAALAEVQHGAGNAVLARWLSSAGGGSAPSSLSRAASMAVQRDDAGPPATQAELDEVTALMPITGDIDVLVSAVEASCAQWRTWRETFSGPVPGGAAFAAMTTFKETIRNKGFDVYDERIQKVMRRRVTGDNRQLLTEMFSFALGTPSGREGDAQALAQVCGIRAKVLNHRYTLKIGYSISPKGKIIVGGGYNYRSAAIVYSNDFGLGYNKPLNMRSFMVSAGSEVGFGVGAGGSADGSDESLSFWTPEDFETGFSVSKVAVGASVGEKKEIKFHEVVRVTSSKHPPLLFDLMGGSHVAPDSGVEAGVDVGGGVELEKGKMVGGPAVGDTTTDKPTLEEAKKKAEESRLTPREQQAEQWMVIGATVVPFATGKSVPQGDTVPTFAKFVVGWANANPDSEVRFDIVGRASPRWRHPKKGRIPADLNLKLSKERGDAVVGALQDTWDGAVMAQYESTGVMGPEMDMDEDHAQVSGRGSLDAEAETADPNNDDAAYRIASVTAWGKKAPPEPEAEPSEQ